MERKYNYELTQLGTKHLLAPGTRGWITKGDKTIALSQLGNYSDEELAPFFDAKGKNPYISRHEKTVASASTATKLTKPSKK